jgi:flavin-dependent dehydrogenase
MKPARGPGERVDTEVGHWAEVVVLGGGPAGAVTSALLARAGVRVALIHADRGSRSPVGEVLPPAARPTLLRLGLTRILEDPAHLRSPGTVSAWGSDVPVEQDFLYSPYGDGLRLDRACFDAHLRDIAAASGVRVVPGTWDVRRAPVDNQDHGTVRVMVDGTGRSAAVARGRGATIARLDALVAVAGLLTPGSVSADADARTFVASVRDGWWYSALLPNGRRVAAFLTDVDLLSREMRRDPTALHAALLRVPIIGSLVRRSGARPPETLRVLAADSRRIVPPPRDAAADPGPRAGPEVVVVGDAAMAFDPLSSQGILSAIESAEEAVGVVLASLGGTHEAAADALARRSLADRERWSRYVARIAGAYADESRWPDAPFWARRRSWSDA